MSKLLAFRPRSVALCLLVLWMVVSSLYYTEQLFWPSFDLGYDVGVLHKALKYFACLALSAYFCLAARAYSLLLFCVLMLLLASALIIDRGALEIATLSIMVVGTMFPFILVPSLWEDCLLLIGRVIVLCGATLGVLSVVELTMLAPLFEFQWGLSGSIRSISTLFNPNNLGLYVGVSLVLLPYMQLKTLMTALCGALLMFALVVSGSRTAWVSILVVLIYALIVSAEARKQLLGLHRHLPQILLTGVVFMIVYAIYLIFSTPPDFEITHRGADLYTVSLRWSNLLNFLNLADWGLLFPDVQGERASFIQDNFYLVVLNSFGIIGLLAFLLFLATHFSPWRNSNPNLFPWKLIFVFYMVSGLSGSQLNSFPNNQLFFMSMGAFWIYRPVFGR